MELTHGADVERLEQVAAELGRIQRQCDDLMGRVPVMDRALEANWIGEDSERARKIALRRLQEQMQAMAEMVARMNEMIRQVGEAQKTVSRHS